MKDSHYNKPRRKSFKSASKGGDTKAVAVNDKYSHIQPVQAEPLEVVVYGNNFDKALRAFRALVQKERVLSLYKEKQTFEKPSDKNRRKRNEMRRTRLELDNPRPPREPRKSKSSRPKSEDTSE